MKTDWLPLASIPAKGTNLVIDDQDFWTKALAEFAITCKILQPIKASVNILPDTDGVLFRGKITGTIALPCNRCTEDSVTTINHEFTSYEPLPEDPYAPLREDTEEPVDALSVDEAVVRLTTRGRGFDINPAALAWEEFSLTLPVHPICKKNCKGLCPVCGVNLNAESCVCEKDIKDPRLAALQGLVIKKK